MAKAVFLDRDGTIIRDMVYLNDPQKIEVFQESYEAVRILNENEYLVFLATNQSGVARGLVDEKNLILINSIIIDDFKQKGAIISAAFYCPHPVDRGCPCRKPNPGMLLDGADKFGVDLSKSWMIGDRMTDVVAGQKAGCQSILLQNQTTPPIEYSFGEPPMICENLLSASQFIVDKVHPRKKVVK